MRAAQDGDGGAYERLLRELTPFIRALSRRHCHNPADVEELVQETLLTVHRIRHTYDPARPISPWIAAIAMRRGIDGLRRRSRIARFETVAPEAAETFADPAANNEVEVVRSAEELQQLLQQLPPRQREALESLKLKELSLAQASALSGQSVGALKVNAHRALKALRTLFAQRDS